MYVWLGRTYLYSLQGRCLYIISLYNLHNYYAIIGMWVPTAHWVHMHAVTCRAIMICTLSTWWNHYIHNHKWSALEMHFSVYDCIYRRSSCIYICTLYFVHAHSTSGYIKLAVGLGLQLICGFPICYILLKPQVFYMWQIQIKADSHPWPGQISAHHTDKLQQGQNNCLWF